MKDPWDAAIEALFTKAEAERAEDAGTAFLAALGLPYERADRPGYLLTADQWANFDALGELADSVDAKRNRWRAAAGLGPVLNSAAEGRRIW